MKLPLTAPPHDRRLLDAGKQTRAMTWIMAIMVFLTVLAGALGLGMAGAARGLDRQLAGRLTIQIVEPRAEARDRATALLVRELGRMPEVVRAAEVDRRRLGELLRPWLGEAGLDGELPIPAMVDVDLASGDRAIVDQVEAAIRARVPDARVDRHARWLAPVRGFIATLGWLALGMIVLMALATAIVVLLAARAGLDTHRATIDVLHMLGATDRQVARLFQRRIAGQTLVGGLIGAVAALAVIAGLQWRLMTLGSELLGSAALGPGEWGLLALLPVAFSVMAMIAARLSVVATLRQQL
ncbi:permease [Sphingomonas sp. SFZ2018-12]|uniref:cell division protein FtsX n=1 Tax=Sphingomonas sp. SFZ2018-12 TaxID=2683197 RepID=UPI001F1169E3|nr:FtsX-like permease family protein [Sphingomonas sp. SFZ2018-12]MCH4893477.1 permease [Sphingomonas sp. SFZ2018-12]